MSDVGYWIYCRLREESTWRGIIAILAASGVVISPDDANNIIAGGMAIIGLINITKRDAKSPDFKKTPI